MDTGGANLGHNGKFKNGSTEHKVFFREFSIPESWCEKGFKKVHEVLHMRLRWCINVAAYIAALCM